MFDKVLSYNEPSTYIGKDNYLSGSKIITVGFTNKRTRERSQLELEFPAVASITPNNVISSAVTCILANKWSVQPGMNTMVTNALEAYLDSIQKYVPNYGMNEAAYAANKFPTLQQLFIAISGSEYEITIQEGKVYLFDEEWQIRCWTK